MGSFKNYALAGILAVVASTTAHAADILPPPPPMPHAPVEVGGGWYLRGDIGMTNQDVDKLSSGPADLDGDFKMVHKDFDSSPLFGLGVGYQFNHWIRADITGEYRGKSTFDALEEPSDPANFAAWGNNQYRAKKSEWVGLANLYFDLGTWYGVTPFIGAGIGFSHNMIDGFVDVNTPNAGGGYFADDSKTEFAWALHAGLAYDLTHNVKVEFAYRYIDLGDAKTGTGQNFDPARRPCVQVCNFKFKDIDSHDFKLGLRWMFGAPVMPIAHAPVVRKY
jgi:opacity protein-like surface antigen